MITLSELVRDLKRKLGTGCDGLFTDADLNKELDELAMSSVPTEDKLEPGDSLDLRCIRLNSLGTRSLLASLCGTFSPCVAAT